MKLTQAVCALHNITCADYLKLIHKLSHVVEVGEG